MAMISCHVAGLFFLPIMPLLIGVIASDFGANSIQIGTLGAVQLSWTAIGAILLSKLVTRVNCRTLVLIAIVLALLVSIASAMADSITTITFLSGISGLTQGVLLASAAATSAVSKNTERVYSFYNSVLAVFAVLGLLVGSKVIEQYGHTGGFLIIALVDFFAFILIYIGFPKFLIQTSSVKRKLEVNKKSPLNYRPMFALVLFGAALSGTQTFIERVGAWHGGSIEEIGQSLAFGWCLAIFSPFLVVPCIRKFNGVKSLTGAYVFVSFVALALSLTTSLSFYLIAAALFIPTALFIESLQFGILGTIDNSGKLAALGPAAISLGSGVGPIFSGSIIGIYGLKSIGIIACIIFLVSSFVLFPLAVKTYSQATTKYKLQDD
jgi:predicted MFS family arabinose efflux permease